MLLVGSQALLIENKGHSALTSRKPKDWDYICTMDQYLKWYEENKTSLRFSVPVSGGKYFHAQDEYGFNWEFELAWEGTSAYDLLKSYNCLEVGSSDVATNEDLYLIKMCHRFKKNSPHFKKTMEDILFLRGVLGADYCKLWMDCNVALVAKRESESYNYGHPKLNVSSKDFFNGDGVNYVYDHDEIHKIVAVESSPAYTKYMQDGAQVMTSKEKFFSVDQRTRLLGGLEESMVLALERSQVPHGLGKEGGPTPRWSFEMALMKVCSSITSGYFREFCWENYSEIVEMYEELGDSWYVGKFKEAVQNGEIVPRNL